MALSSHGPNRLWAFLLCACLVGFASVAGAQGAKTPEQALATLATALRDKDVDMFREAVDVDALFDAPFAMDHKPGEDAWIMPFRQQKVDALIEGVASGVYVLQCREAKRPGCPWYPDGLENARITKKDGSSVLAAVDSAEGIRTWLIVHKNKEGWRITAAPDRLKDAEFYARASFQKSLVAYQGDVRKKLKREAEEEDRYQQGLEKAKEQAAAILASVRIDALSGSIDTGATDSTLTVTGTVHNGHTDAVRLSRLRLQVMDKNGAVMLESDFLVNTRFIQPGESLPVEFSTRVDANKREAALCMDNGGCQTSARAVYVLVGKSNLHVDEDGGGLKPTRGSS